MGDAHLARGEHDGDIGVALLDEVGFLGLVLLFVGGDGPDVEVVDFLVHVVGRRRRYLLAALGLEDANGLRSRSTARPWASMVSTYSSKRMTAAASLT